MLIVLYIFSLVIKGENFKMFILQMSTPPSVFGATGPGIRRVEQAQPLIVLQEPAPVLAPVPPSNSNTSNRSNAYFTIVDALRPTVNFIFGSSRSGVSPRSRLR